MTASRSGVAQWACMGRFMARLLRRRRRARPRSALAAGLAAWLLVFIAEVSPHLVHHAFDEADGDGDCGYLAAANHAPGAAGTVPVVPVAHRRSEPVETTPAARADSLPVDAPSPRGPPLAPLALA